MLLKLTPKDHCLTWVIMSQKANINAVDESSVVGSRENGGEAWEEWMRNKEIQMKARLARVKEVCAKYDSEERWKEVEQGKSFWFDVEHGLAFCTHAKVWYV